MGNPQILKHTHDKPKYVYCSLGPLHYHFRVWVMLIIEDPLVTMKCRSAIKVVFLYTCLLLSVTLDMLPCPFTFIVLTNMLKQLKIYDTYLAITYFNKSCEF